MPMPAHSTQERPASPHPLMQTDTSECAMCEQVLPTLPDGSLPRHVCS